VFTQARSVQIINYGHSHSTFADTGDCDQIELTGGSTHVVPDQRLA
jgi:hypothetical protein